MNPIKYIAQKGLSLFGYEMIKTKTFKAMVANSEAMQGDLTEMLESVANSPLIGGNSKSQIRQDVIVLLLTNFKKSGYFIEFGATNGESLSNSHILEKHFEWRGILAEPDKEWHKDLAKNRSANLEFSCVWKNSTDILEFSSVEQHAFSTISHFSDKDFHKEKRTVSNKYNVASISLLDLLKKHNAPKQIDYLSIDTEGSEYEILNAFDFDAYDIRIITCEHNFSQQRNDIHALLTRNGYRRVFQSLSKFDDWYVRSPARK